METDTNDACDGGGADYRQLGVLREIGNIANGVSEEEFLKIMRITPKLQRVKWHPILKCLKERIQQRITENWSDMWQEEQLSEKLEQLEKLKEKFAEKAESPDTWRPQLGDVKAQLRSIDAAILQRKKQFLELEAKDYEKRLAKLKKVIVPRRGYIRAIQAEMQQCHKRNNEICENIDELFGKHEEIAEEMWASSKEFDCEVGLQL